MATDVPVSIWRTTDGLTDNEYTGINFIVDSLGDYLVDPDDDFIIDTGVAMPIIPASVWVEDDAV